MQQIFDDALPKIYSTRFIFQQDGASCHTSRSTKQYLTRKCVRLLSDWPPQSPDLSPIENLWDYVKNKVMLQNPQNQQQLWEVTKKEFEDIPDAFIKKLYETMPRRITAVLKSKGGHTKC